MIRYNHSKENKKIKEKRMVKIMFKEDEVRKEIEEIIDGMDIDKQYSLFCEYCEKANYYDDRPASVDSIDELCCGMKPSEIISTYGDMDLGWEYSSAGFSPAASRCFFDFHSWYSPTFPC